MAVAATTDMDTPAQWNALCQAQAAGIGRKQQIHAFLEWLEAHLPDAPFSEPTWSLGPILSRDTRRTLGQLLAGDIVAAGLLPQLELLLLTALFHASLGRRVYLFSSVPASREQVRALCDSVQRLTPLTTAVSGPAFGRNQGRGDAIRTADICFCDHLQLFSLCHDHADFPGERPTAALFLEADICLYDGRLGLFEHGTLRALAAIYHSRGAHAPWQERRNVVDLATLAGRFCEIGGIASYMQPRVGAEIRRVYAKAIPGTVRPRPGAPVAALAFKTRQEKQDTLCRDLLTNQGDCLVFHAQESLRLSLVEELRQHGQDSLVLPGVSDLRTFAAMPAGNKRIAFYRGLPELLAAAAEKRLHCNVFIAEHSLLEHQHQKMRAFVDRDLNTSQQPRLYFSLEDDMFNVYADENSFASAFELIAFTERYDRRRRVRRVMGRLILRRIYAMRRACLDEDSPVFTRLSSTPGIARRDNRKKPGKVLGKRLESLCFCGSGKPFRECHGRAQPTS